MNINKVFLHNLLAAKSPSGYERNATKVFNDYMYVVNGARFEFEDNANNAAWSVGAENPLKVIMLSGHIDEIALQVQNIDDKGFIHFIKDGGIDPKTILGSTVTILTNNGEVKGVIGKQPIHIEWRNKDAKDKATEIKDMKIDVGAESKEEVLEMGINIGDPITINDIPLELGKYRFSSRGLDDKIGVYITAEVLRRLGEVGLHSVKVVGVACTQEEVSATGATIAAKRINPDISIDYDVTFATDDEYVSPNEWGDIKLGKGGAIAYGPDNHKELTQLVKSVCTHKGIPYQEFSVGSGATDTVHIKKSSSNAATMLLSIPNRNMHTQVEVCDYRDIESLIDMTVETILAIDKNNGLINK